MSQGGPMSMGLDIEQLIKSLIVIVQSTPANAEFSDLPPEILAEMGVAPGLDPEAILLGSRCLANLIEALPSSIRLVIKNNGLDVLVSKLMSVEYIDLADQVMNVLEKISVDHPVAVIKANGMIAALQYLDFFNLHVQRSALNLVSNSCRGLYNIDRVRMSTNGANLFLFHIH